MDLLYPVVRHLTYDAYLRRDGYAVGPHRVALNVYMDSGAIGKLRKLKHGG